MGRGSADALHTWIECAKLAFADRDACYGDPLFTVVPQDELLSPEYATRRRTLIEGAEIATHMPPSGLALWKNGAF